MITQAKLRHLGVPALKVRRFAGTIKGERVERAMAILDLQSSPTCQLLSKLLRSAVANAVNNQHLSAEYLYVSNVLVDQGPTMKRIRPRARGRAYRVLKRSSHVTIELDLVKEQREAAAREAEAEEQKGKGRRKRASKPAKTEATDAAPAKKKPASKKTKAKGSDDDKGTAKKTAKRSAPRKTAGKSAKQTKEKE